MGTRRSFSGCSARNVSRRVGCKPTRLDSDDEPVGAMTSAAKPPRSQMLEAFDMTNADSDLSESPPVRIARRRIGDEDAGPRSPMVGCVLAERASWQDSSGGRFAVLAEDDTESITNNSPDQCEEEGATDQEFPARRRRRSSITRQEGSEVHQHCMDRAVRGAEALISRWPGGLVQCRLEVLSRPRFCARGGQL